jgi:Domain of unknown function DUF11
MPHTSGSVVPRRRRKALGVLAASLPLFLLAGLLVAPGVASAGLPILPDLVVSISDSPDPVAPGGTVTFTVLVANVGNAESISTNAYFNVDGGSIVSAESSQGDGCTWEGRSVACDLGSIAGSNVTPDAPTPMLAFNEATATIVVTAPNEPGTLESSATADSFESSQSDQNPSDNEDSETTTVSGSEGGGSDSGVIDPGETLSTVTGTNAQPVNAQDPFAIGLTNVSDQSFDGFIEEEPCDGSQEGPLCGTPRVGGVAGNFVFTPVGTERTRPRTGAPAVVIAKLFYDKTIVQGVNGFKIFYQKNPSSPVLQLPRCRTILRSQCFVTKKRASGDQIVRVKLSSDPRVTRG